MLTDSIIADITYASPLPQQINLVQSLFNEILDTSFTMFPETALESYKKSWAKEKLEDRITYKNDLFIFAWKNNKPLGLISGTAPEGGVATIIWLLVKKEFRNQKLGHFLFQQACEYYLTLNCHKLKLTAPSEKAKDFYLKLGMVEEGYHKEHWWKVDFWSLAYYLDHSRKLP